MLPSRRYNGQYGLTDFFNDFFENRTLERAEFTTPAVNVAENETEYHLEVAAPGACKDDFKVHLNRDGNLVIEMEKKCECQEEKKGKYLRKEFACSKFHQTLILPDNVEKDEIMATAENGILCIELPKMQKPKVEEQKRVIEVK